METIISRNLVKKGRKETGWTLEKEPVQGKALPSGEVPSQGSGSRVGGTQAGCKPCPQHGGVNRASIQPGILVSTCLFQSF